ncbi:dual-specificity tyrosine-(Y)-phosphorylation regulated kinase [Reticulomyxa filosa]|uniref:Dual-specificity tyrosine-(Y)-phosphorylation regulated kinase n=1 Tax=Reticulomyxa filosa TaxID=46433 RepID=X6MFI0_RETFI|nr:dual-specificity tyrosine-(Y)-phosphorylation regulated kinase [Reticulomyxa filosa]|eukprot:ETO12664.1 dual-specificity tyrosine-(Y)-phosphorylation regulated kinase [Reticulomyxa filosa]
MFQYEVTENVYQSANLRIFKGIIKSSKEVVEITTIKKPTNASKKEYFENTKRFIQAILLFDDILLTLQKKKKSEALVIVENVSHYNLRDVILFSSHSESEIIASEILDLDLYTFTSSILTTLHWFHENGRSYEHLIPQNIYISHRNNRKVLLKMPAWLFLEDEKTERCALLTSLWSKQFRYYCSPTVLFAQKPIGMRESTYNDIWSFGCCVAELFYGLPLFASGNDNGDDQDSFTDQLCAMFEVWFQIFDKKQKILGYPDLQSLPWSKWKLNLKRLEKKLNRKMMSTSRSKDLARGDDCLDALLPHPVVNEFLRMCFLWNAEDKLSANELLQVLQNATEIQAETSNTSQSPFHITFKSILALQSKHPNDNNDNDDDNDVCEYVVCKCTDKSDVSLLQECLGKDSQILAQLHAKENKPTKDEEKKKEEGRMDKAKFYHNGNKHAKVQGTPSLEIVQSIDSLSRDGVSNYQNVIIFEFSHLEGWSGKYSLKIKLKALLILLKTLKKKSFQYKSDKQSFFGKSCASLLHRNTTRRQKKKK